MIEIICWTIAIMLGTKLQEILEKANHEYPTASDLD